MIIIATNFDKCQWIFFEGFRVTGVDKAKPVLEPILNTQNTVFV